MKAGGVRLFRSRVSGAAARYLRLATVTTTRCWSTPSSAKTTVCGSSPRASAKNPSQNEDFYRWPLPFNTAGGRRIALAANFNRRDSMSHVGHSGSQTLYTSCGLLDSAPSVRIFSSGSRRAWSMSESATLFLRALGEAQAQNQAKMV